MDKNRELLNLLIESARRDYVDILANADFSPGKIEETALQIAISKMILESIGEFQPDFSEETMTLLFYERPLTKIYECFRMDSLFDSIAETISDSIVKIKQEVKELLEEKLEECDDLER